MQSTSAAADLDAALNETQAAEFLGVSVRTLQAWRVRGGGPSTARSAARSDTSAARFYRFSKRAP